MRAATTQQPARRWFGLLGGGILALALASPAAGATFVVDDTVDDIDANPGDGACATATGVCTLRAAVQEANALAGADEVSVPAGIYMLSLPGRDEDLAATGDLDVTEALSVVGAGAGSSIVDAAGVDRIWEAHASIDISGLTLTGGDVPGGGGGAVAARAGFTATDCVFVQNSAGDGAAVYHETWGFSNFVAVRRCTFRSNAAASAGGAIKSSAELTIDECLFEDNRAAIAGGAVWSRNRTIIGDTTFSRNEASLGGAVFATWIAIRGCRFEQNRADGTSGGDGGAICAGEGSAGYIEDSTFAENHAAGVGGAIAFGDNFWGDSQVILRRVTIAGCTAGRTGGALDLARNGGRALTVHVLDSTLSGNHADVAGGAIFVGGADCAMGCNGFELGSRAVLVNSTLSGNSAPRGGAVSLEDAPALGDGGVLLALNSTIAYNEAAVGGGIDAPGISTAELGRSILFGSTGGPDCAGAIVSDGDNVFGFGTGCRMWGSTATDLVGVDPLLGPLQDNGGPTFTHELLEGSPAIDAAADACVDDVGAILVADQRGMPRPDDGNRDGDIDCDIGAFEVGCGPDSDGDGLGDDCDCAPGDSGAKSVPVEADVRVVRDAMTGEALVSWQDLTAEAGTSTVHDVASEAIGALWATSTADAPCVATGIGGPWVDARPVTDLGWYYLVRGVNACGPPVGQGWGRDSLGAARSACP